MQYLRLKFFTIFIALFFANISSGQEEVTLYQQPVMLQVSSVALKDTETVELILPREFNLGKDNHYPVIYLFDRQNKVNYKNNLQAIDYMTLMEQMPPCIIVGVNFTGSNRFPRTTPAYRKGRGDDLLVFLLDELYPLLESNYRAANFKLFIGHSRTAIFSQYALSKRPKDINAVIASSNSYFDFEHEAERKLFDSSLDVIATLKRSAFFFFSTGDTAQTGGDLHAASVRKMDEYMRKKQLPPNLIWKSYFHEGANHYLTPGLTIAPALNSIFDRYDKMYRAIWSQPHSTDSAIAINNIEKEFQKAADYYGYDIRPNFMNYVTLGYDYKNKEDLGGKRFAIARIIWQLGIKHYPKYEGYYSAVANLYVQEKNTAAARTYLLQALANVDNSIYSDKAEKESTRADIKEMLKEIDKQ